MTDFETRLAQMEAKFEAELESVRETLRPLLLDYEERKQQNRPN